MNLLELKKEIESKNMKHLYIFAGEEHNMILRYVHKISKQPVNVDSFKELKPKLQNMNLFRKSTVYTIREDKTILDKDVEKLIPIIKDNIVILLYKEVDKRKALFKSAEKGDMVVEFSKLNINSIIYFITQQMPDIKDEIASIIAVRCGLDMGRVEFELDKLRILNKLITKKLVDGLIKKLPDDVVFDLINALAKRKPKPALMYLKDVLELKENPIPLLYRNFRNILLVQGYINLKPSEISSKTGVNERAIYAIKKLAGYFTLDELIENLKLIFKADIDLKTGRQEQTMAINSLVLKLCGV